MSDRNCRRTFQRLRTDQNRCGIRTLSQTLQTGTEVASVQLALVTKGRPRPTPSTPCVSLLRIRSLSDASKISENMFFAKFCGVSALVWRVGSGLIWSSVLSQVEKRVFDFLQTFSLWSDTSFVRQALKVLFAMHGNCTIDVIDLKKVVNVYHLSEFCMSTCFVLFENYI